MLSLHTVAEDRPRTKYADKLVEDLNRLCNEQFDSYEFKLLADTPLTLARAKFYSTQLVFYGNNRRDCWGFVQARSPFDVKQVIWHHEQDELIHDRRGGTDHITLMSKEALALGVTEEEFAKAQPTPLIRATLMAFIHVASQAPWIGALAASHFMERRNNPEVIKGGRPSTVRWKERLQKELGIDTGKLASSNVHVVADEEHSDMVEEVLLRYVVDEETYNQAWLGAWEVSQVDRAFRAAMACGMRAIED